MWPYVDQVYWNYHNWLATNMAWNNSIMRWDYTIPDAFPAQTKKLNALLRWAAARVEKSHE
jgi:hypothetical protein